MKTTTLKTKAMSILLAIVMLLGMLPISVFSADEGSTGGVEIATAELPAATVGVAYSVTLRATPEGSTFFWNISGLPDGLTADYSGNITGTPTTAGTYAVSVSVGSTGGGSAAKNMTLTVSAAEGKPTQLQAPTFRIHYDPDFPNELLLVYSKVSNTSKYIANCYMEIEGGYHWIGRKSTSSGNLFSEDPEEYYVIMPFFPNGNYYFTMTSVAESSEYLSSEESDYVGPHVISGRGDPFPAPTNLKWDGKVATWDAVDGAASYYIILYNDNEEVTSTYSATAQHDFGSKLTTGGKFSFAVQALGNSTSVLSARSGLANENDLGYAVTINNGTGSGRYNAGDSVTIRPNEPADGYRFGWWEGMDGLSFISTNGTTGECVLRMPERDVTMTAYYEKIPTDYYTMTVINGKLDAYGGATQAQILEQTMFSFTANEPDAGYQFKEWTWTGVDTLSFANLTTKNSKTAFISMPSANVTVTAVYELIPVTTYTITFDANGGTGTMDSVTVNDGDTYTLPTNGFTVPDGKKFKGWATSADGSVIEGSTITVTSDMTLYAIWEPNGYSITFDANGGTGEMATVYALDFYTYPECGFTAPEGYRFAGWSRSANSSIINASGHTIIPSSNITLYARWELIPTLPTPTNLRWNGKVAEWDAVEGADGYTVEFEYSTGSGGGGNTGYYYTNYIDYSYAPDYLWRFRVKAKTNSGNAASEWSEWSDYIAALEPGQLTAPILPDWQGFWPNWRVASEFNGEKHKFVATLYKEGVTDAIAVIEGMPPHDINEIVREKGSGTYYFTVKTVSFDGTAESKTVTSPKKAIDVNKIPQLAAPTNLRWNDTKAEWDAVEGATKYYFELFRDGSRVMTGDGYDTYDELGFLFDDDDLGSGVYTFRVTALAQENGVTLAQAVSEMSGKYIALDAPENIAWDGTVARWGSVENATGYRVYLDRPGELPTQISNVSDTQKDMKEYFTEAGDYTFYVYAYAEVEGYGGQMLSRESDVSAVYAYDPEAYTVTFDRNGGTGYMANVYVSGDYALPACGFTAPAGYEFKAWSVGGTEYAVGNNITVSADTTVTAVWEKLPAEAPTVTASGDLTLTYKDYTDKQVSVSVTEKTGYSYSYQWYDASTDQPLGGATNAAYTVPNDLAAGSYSYYCVATAKRDDNGQTSSSQSFNIAVTVNKATLTADNFNYQGPNDLIFHPANFKRAAVTPKDGVTGIGEITVQYFDEQDQPQSYAFDVGKYKVKINVTEGDNYLAADGLTADGWTFTITKGTQNAPTGLVGAAETVCGKNDGKITGVYYEMEYRKAGETDADYKPITGTEITGLAAGTYYVRLKETENFLASAPATVTIAAGRMLTVTVPQNQIGYTLTADKTALEWHGSTTLAFALADGYSKTDEFSVSATGATLTDNGNGTYTISNAEDNVTVTVNGVADTTAPIAEISISTNKWNSLLNNITFGLFFNKTQDITITATDAGSGLDKIYYLISETELTKEEVETIADVFWTEYDAANKPSIAPDKVCIVYVKAIDKAQNVKHISSDGLVFDGTAPTLEGIENGKTYYGDLTVIKPTSQFGDIEQVTLDGKAMNFAEGTYGLISADNAEHTVVVTDKAGNKTEYKITVYKVYEITFKHPTFETGFPVNHGVSFNEAYPDAVQDMVAEKDEHTFIGWYESTDGGNTLKDTPYDFDAKVTGDVTLYPLFEKSACTVDIGECHYVGCIISGGGSYEVGATVTLTATPADGMKFEYWLDADIAAGWDGDPTEAELEAAIVSYDETYTFTATENVSLEAVFSIPTGIDVTPILIADTDEKSLLEAEWMDVEYDFGSITPGVEQIVLPGEIIEDTVTIGDKHYRFAGFITFGYDEATETETAELKETLTIGAMPLYGSAEYWDWFIPISDGIYAAYMEYTPEDDNNEQQPTDPETPENPQKPSTPQTGDSSHILTWIALLFISGGAVITLTVYDRKRRNAVNGK